LKNYRKRNDLKIFTVTWVTEIWLLMEQNRTLIPPNGEKVGFDKGHFVVPDNPIIPFIEGDGAFSDIWKTTRTVLDAAVDSSYGGDRKIAWFELFAGDKAVGRYGENNWLPDETVSFIKEYRVALKGATNIPSGVRCVRDRLREQLDLYAMIRPLRYIEGLPTPLKSPDLIQITLFRENMEDEYIGIEFESDTDAAIKVKKFLEKEGYLGKVRFPVSSSFAVKAISREGSERIIRAAIEHAISEGLPVVTMVHKGDIMKLTEGYFSSWGYELARKEFSNEVIAAEDCGGNAPAGKILLNDMLTDQFFQAVSLRPSEFSVVAAMNRNGDSIGSSLTAQVGAVGISPGASVNFEAGRAVFEAVHGPAMKYTGLDKANPSSLILSGAMMLDFLGWREAAALIRSAFAEAIGEKKVTFDLARLIDGAEEVKCSEFGMVLISHMGKRHGEVTIR